MTREANTDYQTALNVAAAIATSSLDGDGSPSGIDEQTRESARVFLRAEFEAWTSSGPEAPDDESEDPEDGE